MIVPDQLYRAARMWPERVAAICGAETSTFAEIDERSNRLANALLSQGLVPGDRVANWLENSIRCIEVDFALAKAGLVRTSLNPRLTAREAAYVLQDSDAKAMIHGASFDSLIAELAPDLGLVALTVRVREDEKTEAPTAASSTNPDYEQFLLKGDSRAPAVRVDPEDTYCLFYTSGTTGRPKGAMLSHRAILNVAYNLLMETGPTAIGEKILLMQVLSHGAGFFVLPYAMKGGTSVIMRQFDPAEVLRLALEHDIETIKLVPTMLQRILRLPDLDRVQLPKLKQIIYGASPMPTEPLKTAVKIFGPRLVQIFGQTECPVTLTILTADEHRSDSPHPERLASAGRAWSSVEIRIADKDGKDVPEGESGEVLVRGPHTMSGYWKRPDLTAEVMRDGWLRTKDMGRRDAHGFIYLLGRMDEMIISGGYNIAPREIEDVLYQHDSVQEAAVMGEADAEWGQVIVAYVALKETNADTHSLVDYLKTTLGYKRPKRLYIVDELPKNTTGKIQKTALKREAALREIS